jgi:hypothetical protein
LADPGPQRKTREAASTPGQLTIKTDCRLLRLLYVQEDHGLTNDGDDDDACRFILCTLLELQDSSLSFTPLSASPSVDPRRLKRWRIVVQHVA